MDPLRRSVGVVCGEEPATGGSLSRAQMILGVRMMARSRSRRLAKMLANLRVPRLIRQPAILRLQSWMPATQWSSQRASGSGATIADGLVSSYFDGNADVALWDYPAGGSR